MNGKNGVDENTVVELWRELVNAGYGFTTVNRQPVKVKYPGVESGRGADIQDVVLELNGETIQGNIEFHVTANDWHVHGHDRDKNYNGVVLHVVMWRQTGEITFLENGQVVPTIALGQYYDNLRQAGLETEPRRLLPCAGNGGKYPERNGDILTAAGLERFREKAAIFRSELSRKTPEECLYGGIMEALGYTQNKAPFRALAAAVTAENNEQLSAAGANTRLEAVLYGKAGLLPSQRPGNSSQPPDAYTFKLEAEWQSAGLAPALNYGQWSFFRLRPANYPTRRLSGMLSLLQKYRAPGLLGGLEQVVRETSPADGTACLASAIVTPAEGYWLTHFDFGKECRGLSPWAIGEGRAREIITNVVLPFFYVYGKSNAEKAAAVYAALLPAEENAVTRHMRAQLGLARGQVTGCRQQGLIHLYKKYCAPGKCGECPLGKSEDTHSSVNGNPEENKGLDPVSRHGMTY